jgi:1-acyl-sn-glycerol-3-phosphate acyltransferase
MLALGAFFVTVSAARQDAWFWRLCATALVFTLFGLGSLCVRAFVFPPVQWWPGQPAQRQRRARALTSWLFGSVYRGAAALRVLTYEFEGQCLLGRPGQMIIANHPSLLDVVFLIGHVTNTNCVVKHSLIANIFTGGPVRHAGYITNDESADMIERAAAVLRAGETLIIFPEGTRTPRERAPRFHRGACAIALRGARVITPIVIRMEPRSLTRGEPWYRIPNRRMHFVFSVGPDIDPAQWRDRHPMPIAGRKMNDHLQTYFERELGLNESSGN